jgi:integrase
MKNKEEINMQQLAIKKNNTQELANYINKYVEGWLLNLSETSRNCYLIDVKQFFKVVLKNEIQFVTIDDIYSISTLDISNYIKYLKNEHVNRDGSKGLKNASIKRKINVLRSLFKYLQSNFKDINPAIFNSIKLPSEDLDRESYSVVKWEEGKKMWEYAEQNFGEESNQIAMLIKLACITSIRLNALLNITWEEHFFQKEQKGEIINYIEVIDKNKKHKKSISTEFYNELRNKLDNTGKLFPSLYPHKVGKYIKEIVDALEFDERRKITFHSLKKAGIHRTLEKYGDLEKARIQGNHSSMNTTVKHYMEFSEDLTELPSYSLDQDVDVLPIVNNLSKDELVQAILKMSDSSKLELIRILDEMNKA